ncbi:hypothetical protein HK097_006267, partial [Rhizophlyctis rosea]
TTTITATSTTTATPITALPTPTPILLPLSDLPINVAYGQSEEQREACLAAHNELRATIPSTSTPPPSPLTYNTTMERVACQWSRYLAETKQFRHSNGAVGKFGENLYKIMWSAPQEQRVGEGLGSCVGAVGSWGSEVGDYVPGWRVAVDGDFNEYGHYT